MKTCFVSMPLGTRQDPQTGVVIDFDRVYNEILTPALEEAGLQIHSWRSGEGASTQKEALSAVMSCDVLVADITTSNPNVMYELGVRHASNRGPTVILLAEGNRPPFYVGFLQTIVYDPARDISHPEALRERLAQTLRTAARRSEGSPIYEFFPSLRVELPEDLTTAARRARAYPDRIKRALTSSPGQKHLRQPSANAAELREAEDALHGTSDASPAAYLDLLRAYRDASKWDELIRAADVLPPEVKNDPQTMQLLALALNRRSNAGDQDRAIDLMHELVHDTGGDPETLLILGRIYKDRWKNDGNPLYLQKAADYYRRGFELQPSDYYSGFNAASLLFIQNDPAADAQVASLLPRVKQAIQPELARIDVKYWTVSTAIEISVIERDWAEAEQLVARALDLNPMRDMRLTSIDSIARLGHRLTGPDADALARVIDALRINQGQPDEDYARL